MKRLAILALVAAIVACGSDSSAPSDMFTGTWTGFAVDGSDTLYFSFAPAQQGSTLTGTGTVMQGGATFDLMLAGTSTPPSVNFTFPVAAVTLTYAGTFVKGDSVAGTVSNNNNHKTLTLDLRRN